MPLNFYGHHPYAQPQSLQQEIVTSLGHVVHRLLSEQTHLFLARFDRLDEEISQLRTELVEIKEAGKEQLNQVSQGLKRASTIQATSNEELKNRLDRFENAVCDEDSDILVRLKAIDENVLELYERAADPLAALPEPPLRHEVATSPIKISRAPSTNDDEDVVTAYKPPNFVTADWSVTLADAQATSTPNTANKRVFVPDLSMQGRGQYSLLSNSNVTSLKDCVLNSEARVTYVHTGVSPMEEMQTPSPQPDRVRVDPFEEYPSTGVPIPEHDHHTSPSFLSAILDSPIVHLTAQNSRPSPDLFPTPPHAEIETKTLDPGSPLTSIESDSGDDEEHVSKMVVPSSVSPPIFTPPLVTRRKRLSESPSSKVPQSVSKKRKLEMVLVTKKKRKTIWPEMSAETSSATKWISCDACSLWYHYGCVGIRSDKQPKRFKCPPCQSGQTSADTPHQKNSMECARKDCCHNNADEFVISRIIGRSRDRRTIEGKYIWLVEWEGYDISAATWQEEHTISDPRSLIRQFYKTLQIAGVQNDPETRVILPSVEQKLPEELLALFP